MKDFALIITIAVLLEALVEYGKTVVKAFSDGEIKLGVTHAMTIIIGVGFAFLFQLTLFKSLGIEVDPVADMILTGVIISRGSNYASDLITRLQGGFAQPDGNKN
jgi:hypothetical protein